MEDWLLTIANILAYPNDDAATGVLALDNYGLDIIGNSFTGALDNGQLVETPVGVYVLDSTNGEIENNSAANVDDGVAVAPLPLPVRPPEEAN